MARKRKAGRPSSYPALILKQNQHRFYFATIPIDDLFPYCFVSRREENTKRGFQRGLVEARADDIGKYLSSGNGSIPTNIVLSAQQRSIFKYDSRAKSISYSRAERSFLVLDGQHRLWGYQKSKTRHRVPVAIYQGLKLSEEVKLFIDINTTQRGVPAALLLDIKQIAEMEDNLEAYARNIFNRLNDDPSSALAGRLSAARSVAGKISRVTFNKSITPILTQGILLDMSESDRYRLIMNFINAFDAELEDSSFLTRAAFFEAIFDLFEEIVRATARERRNVKQESIQSIVRPLCKIDYSKLHGSRLTKTAISSQMKAILRDNVQISGEML